MTNHEGKVEGELKKKCPLLKEWCIGDACALHTQLKRNEGGLLKTFGVCAFTALLVIMSEMNAKTQGPQQKIQLPHLLRGV